MSIPFAVIGNMSMYISNNTRDGDLCSFLFTSPPRCSRGSKVKMPTATTSSSGRLTVDTASVFHELFRDASKGIEYERSNMAFGTLLMSPGCVFYRPSFVVGRNTEKKDVSEQIS